MQALASTPTQASTHQKHERCDHGYYVNARELQTPICRTCDPDAYALDRSETSYALALLAMRHPRPRTANGQFKPTSSVAPDFYRCWRCKEVKPLDAQHFRRCSSKRTGFQTRCIHCDNSRKTERRRGDPRPGIQVLLEVGVVL